MQHGNAQIRLLDRFKSLEEVERHIEDLEGAIKRHQALQAQLHHDYKKKINNLERIYKYFPFKKGYKLSTKRDHLVDLFSRFHSAVFELEQDKVDSFIDQVLQEYSSGEDHEQCK